MAFNNRDNINNSNNKKISIIKMITIVLINKWKKKINLQITSKIT